MRAWCFSTHWIFWGKPQSKSGKRNSFCFSMLRKWEKPLPSAEPRLETQSWTRKNKFLSSSCSLQGLFFLHLPFCCLGSSSCGCHLGKVILCLVNKRHWDCQVVWTLWFSWTPLLPWSFMCLSRCLSLIYGFIIFSLSLSLHLAAISSFCSYCLFCITHRIECHLSSQSWGGPRELPGQLPFAPPPLPHPLTSLVFICAHFLSWPWMELSPSSVQLCVYWLFRRESLCVCKYPGNS